MKTVSIKWSQFEYKSIENLAASRTISVDDFMKQTILDRVEDETDYLDAVKGITSSAGESVSRNQMLKRLD
ncbi:DUF6290 family protein [Companilactobacillus mishanensis]|uniref:CopG family transcriptional regulator n=1 Tax=Companilactobacillus mishanensis TaxID=2486008 RepID=A0ABW9P9W8_9LACO|nr:DUF6290 family protein [Companilactobacillus mishanensis]MQS46098.1 hypothetical protein [Companilactobacillus mishanensis]